MEEDDEALAGVVRELLGRLLAATERTAGALEKTAGELARLRDRADATDRHVEATAGLLSEVRPLLAELADRRLAERQAEVDAARRGGYEAGVRDTEARHASAVDVAARGAVAAWLTSPAGRMSLGLILLLLAAAAATMLLPYVDLGALGAVLRFGQGAP